MGLSLGQSVAHVGYFHIFSVAVVVTQLKHKRLHMGLQLLLRDVLHHLGHAGTRGEQHFNDHPGEYSHCARALEHQCDVH